MQIGRANPNGAGASYLGLEVKRIIFAELRLVKFGCGFKVASVPDQKKKDVTRLRVFIIEPSREMQRLLRAMLTNYGIRDVLVFSDTERASNGMLSDPPDIVLIEWESEPYGGADFLKLIRHKNMYPVCLVPVIVTFAEARKDSVENAMKLGANAVVAKPMAPAMLFERIKWVLAAHQELKLSGERYIVGGVHDRLKSERERENLLESAREYQQSQFAEMKNIQNDVDRLLSANF